MCEFPLNNVIAYASPFHGAGFRFREAFYVLARPLDNTIHHYSLSQRKRVPFGVRKQELNSIQWNPIDRRGEMINRNNDGRTNSNLISIRKESKTKWICINRFHRKKVHDFLFAFHSRARESRPLSDPRWSDSLHSNRLGWKQRKQCSAHSSNAFVCINNAFANCSLMADLFVATAHCSNCDVRALRPSQMPIEWASLLRRSHIPCFEWSSALWQRARSSRLNARQSSAFLQNGHYH